MDFNEKRRYSRQIAVEGIGETGQEKLLAAKVIIIGCGALGSMVAMQLAGAGIGNITIVDFDTIDVSNLQRQFFFPNQDVGKSKCDTLAARIRELNPTVSVEVVDKRVTETNAADYLRDKDFIVEATDNKATKMLVDKVCALLGKPRCIGGVAGMHGQIMTIMPDSVMFGDMFSLEEDDESASSFHGGIMGPTAVLCASIQASEVIKYFTGAGELLKGRILTFDLSSNSFHTYNL